jgi:hypothetical protein
MPTTLVAKDGPGSKADPRPSPRRPQPRSPSHGPKVVSSSRAPALVRVGSHIAVWLAVVVPTVQELMAGWRPLDDNAAIAIRAYQSLSLHPPLVGQATAASVGTGHTLYDPGPLLFYLLSPPVRISPTYGLLIGATILVGLVLSVAIEAAWSAGQWVATALVALTVLDLLWLMPTVFQSLPWNAYFPLPFLLSSIVLAWVVSLGKVNWWPVLVVTASIAAQSHLLFLVPAAALVAVALVFGLLGTRRIRQPGDGADRSGAGVTVRSLRWLIVGLGAGLLCWLAPLIQNVGPHGNLSALARSGGQPAYGPGFGLSQVGQALISPPLWMTRPPDGFFTAYSFTHAPPPWTGGLVFGLLILVTVGAFASRRWALGGLGVVALATAAGFAYAYAIFPTKNTMSLGYLINPLWILTILEWCVLVWGLVTGVGALVRRRHAPFLGPPVARAAGAGVLAAALSAVAVAGLWSVSNSPTDVNWSARDVAVVGRATAAIERAAPPGQVNVRVVPSEFILQHYVAEGIAYRLLRDGWSPGLSPGPQIYTGLGTPRGSHAPTFVVTLDAAGDLRSVTRPR